MCVLAWNWGAKAGLFYAGTNLLCNIWCWFRLPETKDRTFGEVDLLFDNKVPARKFKHTKVDRKSFPNLILGLLLAGVSNSPETDNGRYRIRSPEQLRGETAGRRPAP